MSKLVYRQGVRVVLFMNPKICPTCGDRATTVFGARGYCAGCAESMRLFILSHRKEIAQ